VIPNEESTMFGWSMNGRDLSLFCLNNTQNPNFRRINNVDGFPLFNGVL
jgi:hypothetical protein